MADARRRISVVVGDITELRLDAIVNAANTALAGGAGVDGAIHHRAGPELGRACSALGGCPTGGAVLTPGFELPARFVIHTVGPIWSGGGAGEDELLSSCYRASLALADREGLARIAFPCISTGAYRFPPQRAAQIAISTVRAELARRPRVREVVFCCFDERDGERYRRQLPDSGSGDAQPVE